MRSIVYTLRAFTSSGVRSLARSSAHFIGRGMAAREAFVEALERFASNR